MTHINYAGRVVSLAPISKKERNAWMREHFDIPALRKCKFFAPRATFDEMEKRILTFFKFSDIREFAQLDESFNGMLSVGEEKPLMVKYGKVAIP